jgi:hypothetical protein
VRDLLKRLVGQLAHGRFVVSQCVIETHLVLGQTQLLTACRRLAELLGHLHQLFHHLRGFDGAVLVALHHVGQHVGELLVLHHVAGEARLDLAFEQPLQQLHGQVALGQV